MEQILVELSEQNENALKEGERPAEPAEAADGTAPRPRTVRIERDSEFRTPEGVASARAYLPSRTVAPGRKDLDHPEPPVHVVDPRKMPTMRLPRERKDTPKTEGRGRAPRPHELDENAPTLRSASPLVLEKGRPATRWWIGWVLVAAFVCAIVVALAARLRSPASAPAAPARSQAPSATPPSGSAAPQPTSAAPTALPASLTPLPAAPEGTASPSPSSESSAKQRSGQKSDRWY